MQWTIAAGKPDLFFTVTANERWPEVLENIKPGQSPKDRFDIVARVFHQKLVCSLTGELTLLQSIVCQLFGQQKIAGTVKSYTYVIEQQKRGF